MVALARRCFSMSARARALLKASAASSTKGIVTAPAASWRSSAWPLAASPMMPMTAPSGAETVSC